MAVTTIILTAAATLLVAYGVCRAIVARRKPKFSEFVCGTPILRNGGTLIAQTDNMIEIITRDGRETMTLEEYNLRPDRIDLSH